jgi:predicted ATPase/DNA-binding SARP family transcriptional activator
MAAPLVRICLLGGFRLSLGGEDIPSEAWRLRKARTLVKLLALAPGHRLTQEQVGERLWPERDADAVRNNLHQAVHAARNAVSTVQGDARRLLRTGDGLVALNEEDVVVTVDVDEFRRAAGHAQATRDLDACRAARNLYTGDLLPEDRYEDWADTPREMLRDEFAALLLHMARLSGEGEDTASAINVLRTLRIHQPLNEQACRDLMALLASAGRRQEALAEYEALRDALRDEREADPDLRTRRLYRRLLVGSVEEPEEMGAAKLPLRSHNLPTAMSSFVGRDREVPEVERLLRTTRLLTLTGVGGAGKTRLAIEVARRQRGAFPHGVWLVDLTASSDPDQVPTAVAEVLGLELPKRGPPLPAVVDQLTERRLLLLLDNCEHLVAACATLVAAIQRSCPGVVLLATSREALRVEGEVAWRVPSLALPDLHRLPSHTALARQASVRLFCERALAVEPDFELTNRNARTVAELCVRLDGMPLALELAAAQVRLLSPAQILERLSRSLDILAGTTRAGVTRQRTLSDTLDWSHQLLTEAERTAFRRLAVFAGGFPLEAAEDVCGAAPLDSRDVLGLLGELVDKSLVVREDSGDAARLRLPETVRQYARERLSEADELISTERRHGQWYRDWALSHDLEGSVAAGEQALAAFDVEHDNLRAALRSALAHDPETALQLATSLWRFWLARGHFTEGRRWLNASLAADVRPSALRARGLIAVAILDFRYATSERLEQAVRETIAIHEELGDRPALAQALMLTATLRWASARIDEVTDQLDRACALAVDVGALHVLAAAHHTRGVIELGRGRPSVADLQFARCSDLLDELDATGRSFFPAICIGFPVEWDGDRPRLVFEETLQLGHHLDAGSAGAYLCFSRAWASRAAGELDRAIADAEASAARFRTGTWHPGVALAENLLGNLHRQAGRYTSAGRYLQHSLELRTRLGDRRATGVTLGALGLLAAAQGDAARSQRHLRQALRIFQQTDDRFGEAGMMINFAAVAMRSGDYDTACRLLEQFPEEFWNRLDLKRVAAWVSVMRAETAEAQHEPDAATTHLDRADAIFASLGEEMGLRWRRDHQPPCPVSEAN